MGTGIGAAQLLQLFSILFTSVSDYVKFSVSLGIVALGVINMFSDILPPPGNQYQVPSVEEVDAELKAGGRIIYTLVKISRTVTIVMNEIICSKYYRWFYKTTKFIANLGNRIRGKRPKSATIKITRPHNYTVDFDKHDHEQ